MLLASASAPAPVVGSDTLDMFVSLINAIPPTTFKFLVEAWSVVPEATVL